jgi:hypothetical protein
MGFERERGEAEMSVAVQLTQIVNDAIRPSLRFLDVQVTIRGDQLTLADEFGSESCLFADDGEPLRSRVLKFWSDYLRDRNHQLLARMRDDGTPAGSVTVVDD